MLPAATSYDQLFENFHFDIPEYYNIGVDVCDKWANIDPDRIAIISYNNGQITNTSFAELKNLSNRIANQLVSLGAKAGDRIGVLWPQSVETAAAHIAIYKLGGIAMPLFNQFGKEALISRLSDSGTTILVADKHSAAKVQNFKIELPDLKHIISPSVASLDNYSSEFSPVKTNAEDPALIIYTSGTTGNPKGALHAHKVLLGHLPGVEMSHDLFPEPDDVIWTPADWAWIGGLLDVLLPGLHHGVPVVASRFDKFEADSCKALIEKTGVKNIFFPPTALRLLRAEGFSNKSLRTVASGGEPLGAETLKWGQQALGLTINEFYGQTECNMVVSSCASIMNPNAGSAGKPVPGHQVAIINDEGDICEDGIEGAIAIKRGTPVMMLNYWNNGKATKDKFIGAWLITGDRGIMHDGWIYFQGRDDDVITSAGYRIGPAEIENCLLSHDCVAQVGVIGKSDELRTQIVKAYVLLKKDYSPTKALKTELQSHVKSKLAAYEYPREVEFVDTLPMTVTGKIMRRELRKISELESKLEST